MPNFKVEYTTSTKPILPFTAANAKVEEVSAVPFAAKGRYDAKIRVEQSALDSRAAYILVTGPSRSVGDWLSTEDTRELYEALKEIVGA